MGIVPTNIEHELKSVDIVVSKGDKEGRITYANPIFVKLTGYSQGELLDEPHSIVRHPDMPKLIFKFLWDKINSGDDVNAFVKNMSKDGGYYWVLAHVRIANNPDGSFRNFVSTRKPVADRAKQIMTPLYAQMLEAESSDGDVSKSLKILEDFLAANGESLATFNDTMIRLNS